MHGTNGRHWSDEARWDGSGAVVAASPQRRTTASSFHARSATLVRRPSGAYVKPREIRTPRFDAEITVIRQTTTLAAALALLTSPAAQAEKAPDRPNVLWLSSEDHGVIAEVVQLESQTPSETCFREIAMQIHAHPFERLAVGARSRCAPRTAQRRKNRSSSPRRGLTYIDQAEGTHAKTPWIGLP
jgi:hypothetical protein